MSARAPTSGVHSGWTITTAAGVLARAAPNAPAGSGDGWGSNPCHTINARPVWRATKAAR